MEGGRLDGVWWGRLGVGLCGVFVLFHPLWCMLFCFVMKRFFSQFHPQKGKKGEELVVPELRVGQSYGVMFFSFPFNLINSFLSH